MRWKWWAMVFLVLCLAWPVSAVQAKTDDTDPIRSFRKGMAEYKKKYGQKEKKAAEKKQKKEKKKVAKKDKAKSKKAGKRHAVVGRKISAAKGNTEEQLINNVRAELRRMGLKEADIQERMAKLDRIIAFLKQRGIPIPSKPFTWHDVGLNSSRDAPNVQAELLHMQADETVGYLQKREFREYTFDVAEKGDLYVGVTFGKSKVAWVVVAAFPRQYGMRVYKSGGLVLAEPPKDYGLCGNLLIHDVVIPHVQPVPPVERQPGEPIVFGPPPKETGCVGCSNFFETNAYGNVNFQDTKGGMKTGFGGSADVMYWWNMANITGDPDCSHWYLGLGAWVSGSEFETSSHNSVGSGYKFGVQEGLKYAGYPNGYYREFLFKFRQGWSWTEWEGFGPGWSSWRRQHEFGLGGYSRFLQEIVKNKIDLWASVGFWAPVGDSEMTGSRGQKLEDNSFAEFLVGIDHHITERLTHSIYGGLSIEGWSRGIPAIAATDLQYDSDIGKFAVGAKFKVYSAVNPMSILYGEFNRYDAHARQCTAARQAKVKAAGKGIGGRMGPQETIQPPQPEPQPPSTVHRFMSGTETGTWKSGSSSTVSEKPVNPHSRIMANPTATATNPMGCVP